MKLRNGLALLLVLVMCLALLAGCGGSSNVVVNVGGNDESSGGSEPAEEAGEDADFLLGMWFAKEASYSGETRDPDEVFGGIFSLYFSDDGKCTMAIDQNRALLDWERTDDGVTLTGDNTYPITFPDDTGKNLVININGIDVLMEKYEE